MRADRKPEVPASVRDTIEEVKRRAAVVASTGRDIRELTLAILDGRVVRFEELCACRDTDDHRAHDYHDPAMREVLAALDPTARQKLYRDLERFQNSDAIATGTGARSVYAARICQDWLRSADPSLSLRMKGRAKAS